MNRRTSLVIFAAVCCLASAASVSQAQVPRAFGCGTGVHVGEDRGLVWLPEGDLFCPVIADPKAERSFVSVFRGEFPSIANSGERITIGSVGLSDRLAIFRVGGPRSGDGLQLAVVGAIFAQFDLDAESYDLINADYLIGLPLSARLAGFSTKLTLFHQSSHLGDEFLLRSDLERENLSFEAAELIVSQEFGPLRLYVGGQYLFNREPDTLQPMVGHGGAEVRYGATRGVRFVAAADLKASEQQDWDPAISIRTGVELAHWRDADHPPRLFALLAEFYDGPSPYGQFFQEQIRYLGVGLHVSLR